MLWPLLTAAKRRGQPELLHQLYESARLSKVQLSSTDNVVVHVPSSRVTKGPEIPITRKELEQTTQWLRFKLGPPLERLGKECHVEWAGE